jgi:8-oxo-dGTP diphosphatase
MVNSKTYDVTKYDRPSVTVDIVVFTILNNSLKVLLIKRKEWPFKGMFALPGGFIKMNENLQDAAVRELREETGVKDIYMEQLYTFGDVNRDPRTRVLTVTYLALINGNEVKLNAGSDALEAKWFCVKDLPKLGFDHEEIINYAYERVKSKLSYSNIAFSLLSDTFTLTEAQNTYEIILNQKIDKRNFRKKINSLGLVIPTNRTQIGAHRPAKLYKLASKNFELKIFG